ncbi:hypothetical protein [Caulobacter sp.]|uniref:hypothetical protein n=1 Tax=Caulobacter sp. TaxID=78 RepID=UPI0031E2CD02
MLTTDTLIEIVQADLPRLTRIARQAAVAAAGQLRIQGVVATRDSAESRSLRSMLTVAPDLFAPSALGRFDRVELYGVASPLPLASVRFDGAQHQIVIFNGLIQQVHFFADLITVLDGLIALRPETRVDPREGALLEAEAFSMAGFSLLSAFLRTGQPLPPLHDMLGPGRRQNVKLGVAAAIAFALLHELSHVELGHLAGGARNDIGHMALLEPEHLSLYQAEELEADRHALELIEPHYRQDIQSSLIFLFGSYAFLEAFSGGEESHPLAINRLAALADAAALPEDVRDIVVGWITARSRQFRALAEARSSAGGDAAQRIEEVMPAALALQMIAEIKQRVLAEHGLID